LHQNIKVKIYMKKVVIRLLQVIGGLMLAVTTASFFNGCATNLKVEAATNIPPQFSGTILVASDADQIGTAYADGVVNKLAGIEDSLTIIRFDAAQQATLVRLPASNSVISWPSIIGTSPDGRYAYIAETRGAFAQPTEKVSSVWEALPTGQNMTVVDLISEKVVQIKAVGNRLGSASVNSKGDWLVTTSTEKDKEIVLIRLKNGLMDSVFAFPCKVLEQVDKGKNFNDTGVKTIEFHPVDNIIAVNIHNKAVAFYTLDTTGTDVEIGLVGKPLPVANNWSVGNWTPNGRYFILTDVNWGAHPIFGSTLNKNGSLVSVAFDKNGNHTIASKAEVGLSPEGFDLSPDGRLAIVANMRRTYLSKGMPYALFGARNQASLSLVSVDPTTGVLKTLGKEYAFEGELPEDAIFDADSKSVAVAIYNERYESKPRHGFIEFWRVEGNKLLRTNTRIAVTRGSHNLKLVK
jgi:DNA-binding beta-propeller fold protein YncE